MQSQNPIFDEIAKLMTNAAGAAKGFRDEMDTFFRAQAERILAQMDVVTRDEFDAVKAMALKAREEVDALKARVDALEAEIAKQGSAHPRSKAARKVEPPPET